MKDINHLTRSEIRKLSEAELRPIVSELSAKLDVLRASLRAERSRIDAEYAPKLKTGERVHYPDVPSYGKIKKEFDQVSEIYQPFYNRLEKFEKINRAKAREEKKNSKEVERKRIEGLASTLRKNLIPVENALSESIIKHDNERLERHDEFFKSLPSPYLFRLVSHFSNKSDEIEYSTFNQAYRRFWLSEPLKNDYRPNAPYKAVKKDNVSEIIVKDAKAYAKDACDSFACKIVQKTEEEIASRKSSEKIVSTTYKGNINPWDGAKVIVKTDKGEYVWNTKVILNFSKYGLPFNQWPTRLAE